MDTATNMENVTKLPKNILLSFQKYDEVKDIFLIDDENIVIEIPVEKANMSVTIKNMICDIPPEELVNPIPIINTPKFIFDKILEFCDHYVDKYTKNPNFLNEYLEKTTEDIINYVATDPWNKDFCDITKMDTKTLHKLILAANYLDIKPLLDIACIAEAGRLKGLSPEEIRQRYNLPDDWTEEEEEAAKKELENDVLNVQNNANDANGLNDANDTSKKSENNLTIPPDNN
jgi:S-phase kinase-associated protein 1